jgi:hypothetical protein
MTLADIVQCPYSVNDCHLIVYCYSYMVLVS